MSRAPLFQPYTLGPLTLQNRFVMAPMTRTRAPERIPTPLMAEYYRQRASAGLIVTEATQVTEVGAGGMRTPGLHTPAQVAGWRGVTQAAHAGGAKVFVQLWHAGRAHHPSWNARNEQPVAPSAIAVQGPTYTPTGVQPHVTPRALEVSELPGIVAQFVHSARLALEAGFDGVELHAANGYLLDQFLRDSANRRTDAYGGSVENRARLLLEVTDAVAAAIGRERVGVRVSPTGTYQDMKDSDPVALFTYVARELSKRQVAYLHVSEPVAGPAAVPGPRVTPALREAFRGTLILSGGYTGESANAALERGEGDLVAFGVPFLANPDLPERLASGAALNAPDFQTFYTPDAKGYTDYPALGAQAA
ncbi:alkene reductase [Aggregicoccus sp. 17bor-14]|uniref:alkene reductase n=1 Tax=Myxococcaceae TaxID=31 RepID=UPI00129CBE38|nr:MULTISPECIES: alkene reductase [Myxococcaceae]MBF5041142.1 alkene reductase [Simulacricoccus sp. 17bor-14]MRI86929.1 alkene reductase [Aggregicoccus sp. 17bor-14]